MTGKKLSSEAFAAARRFIEAHARDLEVARFHFHFDGAPPEPLLDALAAYQNADGGFGHALEPDFRAAQSSALCTSHAFQILRATRTPGESPLVTKALAYLVDTLDQEQGCWHIIPRLEEPAPHAPWWNPDGLAERFNHYAFNPTAEILGYLYDYRAVLPSETLSLVSLHVVKHLLDGEEIEMHDFLCCARLWRTQALPEDLREALWTKLIVSVSTLVARDPQQWNGYSLRPLQVVMRPDSPFMAGLEDALAANLDYEISSQNPDGSWSPNWTWGEAFPDVWEKASREWSAIITLDKLLLLRSFERLAALA